MPILQKADNLDIEYLLQQSGNKFFRDYIPTKTPLKMYEVIKISTDELTIKLIDKNQRDLLSIVHGSFKTHNKIKYFEITGTFSKVMRAGFLTYLFEILIYEFDYKILSDSQHSSPGSKEFWQAHLRRSKFSIYRLNLKTNFKRNANQFKESEIWKEVTSDYLNNQYYPVDDDIDVNDNFIDLIDDFEEVIEELNINNISDEALNIEINSKNAAMKNIRLVAQKYVG